MAGQIGMPAQCEIGSTPLGQDRLRPTKRLNITTRGPYTPPRFTAMGGKEMMSDE